MFSAIRAFFDRAHLPSPEYVTWCYETFEFLLERFGEVSRLESTPAFVPTPDYFDVRSDLDPEEIAEAFFEQTRRHCGLESWPVKLVPQGDTRTGARFLGSTTREGAVGTYLRRPDGVVEITYDPEAVDRPVALVATFAHELAHYLLDAIDEVTPGGHDREEPATDITAVFLGFGVFLANAAFEFEQFQDSSRQGWSMSRQGYLTEQQLAFSLALFAKLSGNPDREVRRFLDANPRAAFDAARRYLDRHKSDWDHLSEIAGTDILGPPMPRFERSTSSLRRKREPRSKRKRKRRPRNDG